MSPRHNHFTRDIKPRGICPACDAWREWEDATHTTLAPAVCPDHPTIPRADCVCAYPGEESP